ncbi:transposase [Microbacterium terricola]|uniref:Transposase n=1 Tax=Microbacterium terricola TaxID=344163 RepID=A0ABM8E282_9MICO|nr:transposase [Microbacterium terricola]UYK40387.1 transposase [Microbacterium terricola]BDV31895.1 hypothetical protein Microterr_25550 [Microbacterium terricola]
MAERSDDDLDAIVVELLTVTPAEFTAARTDRARQAPKELAARIKALRKPSVSAWTVDLLAREGLLGEALELAASLREAQDDLDAAELSRLGGQRRQLVAALAAQAVDRAAEHGVQVSASARTEVEQTLNAAMIDADAAAAVLSARLVRPLEAAGFGGVDLGDALEGSQPAGSPVVATDDLAERRARKAAEKAVRDAEHAAEQADRERARIATRRDKVQERVERLDERVTELRRDLARVEAEQEQAAAELAEAAQQWDAADEAARAAASAAHSARDALE